MAIICYPALVGKVPITHTAVKDNSIQKTVQKSKKLKEVKLQAVTIGNTTITPLATTITIDQMDEGSERDEAEGDDEEMEVESDEDVSFFESLIFLLSHKCSFVFMKKKIEIFTSMWIVSVQMNVRAWVSMDVC